MVTFIRLIYTLQEHLILGSLTDVESIDYPATFGAVIASCFTYLLTSPAVQLETSILRIYVEMMFHVYTEMYSHYSTIILKVV